jgi:adenine-specific DNA-methyltransferase
MSWPGGGGPNYDVIHPVTKCQCKVPDGGWRYSTLKKMNEMIASGHVQFREDHTQPPIRKTYLVRDENDELDDEEEQSNDAGIQVAGTYFYRSALQASTLMLNLFGAKVFESPKDHEVIARWIGYVCALKTDDIILDFFGGSGTTAQAVLELNQQDNGNRKFILVQLPEQTKADSEAYKAGFKKISDITI